MLLPPIRCVRMFHTRCRPTPQVLSGKAIFFPTSSSSACVKLAGGSRDLLYNFPPCFSSRIGNPSAAETILRTHRFLRVKGAHAFFLENPKLSMQDFLLIRNHCREPHLHQRVFSQLTTSGIAARPVVQKHSRRCAQYVKHPLWQKCSLPTRLQRASRLSTSVPSNRPPAQAFSAF